MHEHHDMPGYGCGILTVSDKGSRGERQDTSGPALREILAGAGFTVQAYEVVADREEAIAAVLVRWVDELGIDLVVTTGGTGVSPTDVTPEATRPLLHRELPGMAEAMRQASLAKTPNAMLSRGLAGIRAESLIINLPGSERAARENIAVVLPALGHALYKLKGGARDCGAG